jgi:plastocyanin
VGTLSLRAFVCAAACALTLACTGDSAPAHTPVALTAEPEVAATLSSAAGSTATPSTAPSATPVPAATSVASPQASVVSTAAPASTPTPGARPAPATLRVTLDTAGLTFEPHQVHGNLDDTVVVTINGSDERHSFTIPVLGLDRTIDQGRTVVVSFVLPLALGGAAGEGTFPFYCRFHGTPTSGMHGLLIFH